MSIESLPLELIVLIIQNAYYFYSDRHFNTADHRTLSACSLVHPLWREPSQRLLFYHIPFKSIRRFFDCDPLTQQVTGHTTALLSHVRILEILLGLPEEGNLSPAEFCFVLARCPNVYELSLLVHGIISLDPSHSQYDICRARNPPIRCLRIIECSVQSRILYELLDLLRGVQFLFVGVEIVASPPSTPLPDLRLYELVLQRTLGVDILSWLLSSSKMSLRILEMRDLPSSATNEVLAKHSPYIESLRLMPTSRLSLSFLRSCTNLKDLICLNIPKMVSLAQVLPPSLEHLCIVNLAFTSGLSWGPVITAVEALPNLRRFSCDVSGHGGAFFSKLEETCQQQGVLVDAGLPTVWVNYDPVKVKRFPRRRSISNFLLMPTTPQQETAVSAT